MDIMITLSVIHFYNNNLHMIVLLHHALCSICDAQKQDSTTIRSECKPVRMSEIAVQTCDIHTDNNDIHSNNNVNFSLS